MQDMEQGLHWELNLGLGMAQGCHCCPQTKEGMGKVGKGWRR